MIHENTHAVHYANKCKCKQKRQLEEYHASKEVLIQLLKEKDKTALRWAVEHIEICIGFDDYTYKPVAQKIMKLKLWQKCKKFVAK